jgi:hypothetical protein
MYVICWMNQIEAGLRDKVGLIIRKEKKAS